MCRLRKSWNLSLKCVFILYHFHMPWMLSVCSLVDPSCQFSWQAGLGRFHMLTKHAQSFQSKIFSWFSGLHASWCAISTQQSVGAPMAPAAHSVRIIPLVHEIQPLCETLWCNHNIIGNPDGLQSDVQCWLHSIFDMQSPDPASMQHLSIRISFYRRGTCQVQGSFSTAMYNTMFLSHTTWANTWL